MEDARDNPSMETGESQEQEGSHPGSTKRQEESPLCNTDGRTGCFVDQDPFPAHDQDLWHRTSGEKVLFWAFGMGPSAENVGKSHGDS